MSRAIANQAEKMVTLPAALPVATCSVRKSGPWASCQHDNVSIGRYPHPAFFFFINYITASSSVSSHGFATRISLAGLPVGIGRPARFHLWRGSTRFRMSAGLSSCQADTAGRKEPDVVTQSCRSGGRQCRSTFEYSHCHQQAVMSLFGGETGETNVDSVALPDVVCESL